MRASRSPDKLAALPPPAINAGGLLDDLVGPWIDQLADGNYRLSPLLKGLSSANLTASERLGVDRHIAETFTATRSLDVERAGSAYVHALAGKSTQALRSIAVAVLAAPLDALSVLARWTTPLRVTRTDVPIYPDDPATSRMLRLVQVLLDFEAETPRDPGAAWAALKREISSGPNGEEGRRFEFMAYAMILQLRKFARFADDWLSTLVRFDEITQQPEWAATHNAWRLHCTKLDMRGRSG